MLAQRAISHGVVKVNLAVKLDRDVNGGDTEPVLPLVAAKRSRLVLGTFVDDGLVAKGALGERITLAEGVAALPVLGEVKVAVLEVAVSVLEIAPVEAALLLVAALIVGVLRRAEGLSCEAPGGSYSVGGNAGQECVSGLHIESSVIGIGMR